MATEDKEVDLVGMVSKRVETLASGKEIQA